MTSTYTCVFCHKPGTIEHGEIMSGVFNLEKWLSRIACVRCANYESSRRTTEHAIYKTLADLKADRYYHPDPQNNDRVVVEEKARKKLIILTKRFAKLVCDHLMLQLVWEPDIVDQITSKPDTAYRALDFYRHNLQKYANDKRTI